MRKNKEGVATFQAGVADMLSNIVVMRSSIEAQMKANQEYFKKFYG